MTVMDRATATHLTNAVLIVVQAAITSQMRKKIETLKENDWILVYHGTRVAEVHSFINGFDANKVHSRSYGGPKHKGVFVTADPEEAKHFASYGRIVFELLVRAKDLHGVDYSGNIGREQGMNETTRKWMSEKYPQSFRPYLSMTMLQPTEPQGLLRGLVKPQQIKRIWYDPAKGPGGWYTRKEFIDLGIEVVPARDQPYGQPKKVTDLGFDLSYPGYTVEEFFDHAGKILDLPADKVVTTFQRYANRGDRLEELIDQLGFDEKATEVYTRKIREHFGSQK